MYTTHTHTHTRTPKYIHIYIVQTCTITVTIYTTTRSAHFTVLDDCTADRRARETLNTVGRTAAHPAGRNPIAPGQHVAARIRRR